jgi:hypothetical protein
MKQHPFYFALTLLAGLYLAFANARGWSLLQTMSLGRFWGSSSHGSSFSHK